MTELFNYLSSHFYQFFFVFIRLSAFFMAFPFFSTPFLPLRVKVVLLLAFSFFFSHFVSVGVFHVGSTLQFSFLVLKELLLGFLLALVALIFYSIVSYAGELISYMMGLTVANLFDPNFGVVSIVGRLFTFTFYAVFFATGGEKFFIAALYRSFQLLPVGRLEFSPSLFDFLLKESSLIFTLGFKMAFPFVFSLFITNLALALINRLIPQVNVFIVGLPVQIFVGLSLLFLGYGVVVLFNVNLTQRFLEDLLRLISLL
ncbi:flagellar biosynthetic protein FliR [Thermovibrio sp.]